AATAAFLLGPEGFGRLMHEGVDPATRWDIVWHESLGLLVLGLTLLRLLWVALRPGKPHFDMPLWMRLLSRAARGSMRDALSLTDQAIAFGAGQLTEAG
ncbi:hypothetical protein ABTK60_19195, partial [Acinetobacter baumannii]